MRNSTTRDSIIRKVIARLMVPFIQLFGLYVIVHGDSGPGGGFQGGVIISASVILYSIVFGIKEARQRLSQKAGDVLSSAGIMLYAGVGIACLFFAGSFLQYSVLPFGGRLIASHYGIFLIEAGIGITVAAVMAAVFFEVSEKDRDKGSSDA